MELLPAIDLRGGRVVRLKQGDYGRETVYAAAPVREARAFADAGARWLHVVDLDGAKSGEPAHAETIAAICRETGLRVQVGGGVRSERTIDALLEAGAARVVLGTAALRDWAWFEAVAHRPQRAERIALGLDARDGMLAVSGWREQTDTRAVDLAAAVTDWPLGAVIYTDIAADGMMGGPSLDETRAVAEATRVPVIASGGVGALDHLRALAELPIAGAIVGKALYEGAFSLAEALRAASAEENRG